MLLDVPHVPPGRRGHGGLSWALGLEATGEAPSAPSSGDAPAGAAPAHRPLPTQIPTQLAALKRRAADLERELAAVPAGKGGKAAELRSQLERMSSNLGMWQDKVSERGGKCELGGRGGGWGAPCSTSLHCTVPCERCETAANPCLPEKRTALVGVRACRLLSWQRPRRRSRRWRP